jgi:hypothetical protein
MSRIVLCALIGAACAAAITGCTTVRESYPGRDPHHVWTAMRAVAETPEYSDWRLRRNNVWHDPNQTRMEVYRELERSHRRPGARPLLEQRTYRFQIVLEDEPEPTARFVARSFGIPIEARTEANRYFAEVWRMLQSPDLVPPPPAGPLREDRLDDLRLEPDAPPAADAPQAEPPAAPVEEPPPPPPVDIEDLLDEPGC